MKAYTDISQSKILAEFLPLESADMRYSPLADNMHPWIWTDTLIEKDAVPCWSLAALLDVLENEIDGEKGETYKFNIEKDGNLWNVWYREQCDEADPIETESTENLIDACYEMIVKLHEQNLL